MANRDPRERFNTDPDAISDNEPRERRLRRPEANEGEEPHFRERGDWFDAIGPEGEDPDVIEDALEDYGWDKMDDVIEMSLPSGEETLWWKSDTEDDPDVIGDTFGETPVDAEDNLSVRPVEDAVIEELDGDDDIDDPDDPEDDLNFPQPRDL